MKNIFVATFFLLFSYNVLLANGAAFRHGIHGGLKAVAENRIQLTKEEVFFDASCINLSDYIASMDGVPVKCIFYFTNISKDTVVIKVGFPFIQNKTSYREILKVDFSVFIDNEKIRVYKDSNDVYTVIYLWDMVFLPWEKKIVICSYYGFADVFSGDGVGERWTFRYIAHTGGLWAAKIDTAKFTFLLPLKAGNYLNRSLEEGKRKNCLIQPKGYTHSKDKINWLFIDWQPDTILANTKWNGKLSKDDILITFENIFLKNFQEYFDLKNYVGDKLKYNHNDYEVIFTQDQFDKEEEYEIQYLRLLRNEIFARKGMVFHDYDLINFFSSMSWYKSDSTFDKNDLNDFEKENIETIIKRERAAFAFTDSSLLKRMNLYFGDAFKKKTYIGDKFVYSVKDIDNKRGNKNIYARLLLNEIYARHGLIFKSFLMKNFFEPFTWYEPKVIMVTDFNDYERKNILLLKEYLQKE